MITYVSLNFEKKYKQSFQVKIDQLVYHQRCQPENINLV